MQVSNPVIVLTAASEHLTKIAAEGRSAVVGSGVRPPRR
jgi:hypothetical protein